MVEETMNVIWLILAVVMTGCFVIEAVRFRQLHKKITYILEAARSRDFSFRFQTHKKSLPFSTARIANNSFNEIIAILAEVTDEVRQREEFFEILINSAETAILLVDKKGIVLQSNPAACRLFGRHVISHISQITPIDRNRFAVQTTALTLHNQPVELMVVSDIRHELDQKEQESWEKLTRVLTHEIMNAVTPIASLSSTLQELDPQEDADDIRRGLTTIRHTSSNLMQFVQNYRQYSLLPHPVPALFYVKPFLQNIIQLDKSEGCTVTLECPDDLIVHSDESLISRVVINIMKNAIQALASEISIAASCLKDESVVIDITNNGLPIPPEEEEQIFIPFFSTKPDGSGIGLSLSRRIMQQCGGELTLHCNRSKRLTTFRLRFF